MNDILDEWQYFASPVYSIKKPEFLPEVLSASNFAIKEQLESAPINEIYPVVHASVLDDPRCAPLLDYVVNTAWNLLDAQGYDMSGLATYFEGAWCQDHRKYSSMEYHVHNDSQVIAFYFLECPEDCPKFVIHDPRPSKNMIPLKQKNTGDELTYASGAVYFTPEPGTIIFTNSWLPHSFMKNPSDTSFKFIHMNVSTRPYVPAGEYPATAEIV